MADLTIKFRLVDELSEKLENMAESGQSMIEQWEQAGEAVNSSFEDISSSVTSAAASVDGVATSIDSLQGAVGNAASSSDALSDSMDSYGNAAAGATEQTDYWTDAVGNYDKSALEAVYSTEELVEMGLKSVEALEEQERMFELCEQSASSLSKSIEATADITSELASAINEAASMSEELAKSDEVSAETKEELTKASEAAAQAMNELTTAQQEAEAAMQAYDDVMISGTTDLSELEAAAERAGHAAENLAEANGKASEATEELSKATEKASEEAEAAAQASEKAGNSGIDTVNGIASALTAAGITAMVKEIAEGVYELADAFSEAESIIVDATGATGDALASLEESMMSAYSNNYNELNSVAGAIGEINTRMGLTGDELTDVTDLFLDFSNITGSNVVTSVQNATKIMNKWGLEANDIEIILDELAYAGQISGASVDSLSNTLISGAANFQNMGLSLENAISLLAQFELAGINGTSAITAIRTAVNNFADDGIDAQAGLQSVITEIANMEDVSEATALAVDTFGSRAGQELALAIRNGTLSVDAFSSTMEEAIGTIDSTAEASETLANKWETANNKIKTAFTSVLEPVISKASAAFADLWGNVGDFLNEHPNVTKAITAIGTGLGVAAIAIAGVSAASLTAIPAVAALGTAISAAIWPITAVAAGIAAVTAAVLILKGSYDDAYDETMSMTAVTAKQTEELEELEAEYEKACEIYGETSDEASTLKYQIDDLSASLEANGQSVEELVTEVDNLIAKHDEMFASFDEATTAINDEEVSNLALIAKLNDLATATTGSSGAQEAMKVIIDELNESIDGLNLTYEDLITNQDVTVESIRAMAQAEAERQKQQEKWEEYIDLIGQAADEEEELAKMDDEVTAATLRAEEAHQEYFDTICGSDWKAIYTSWGFGDIVATNNAAQDALDEVIEKQGELQDTYDETTARLTELEEELGITADSVENVTASMTDDEAAAYAAATAYNSIQSEINNLCTAYDEAYQAAIESFEGQFGLFDEAEADMEATVANAQAALDSQLAYWENYGANLEVLKNTSAEDLDVTQENYEALIAYAQSGSEEAAGLAASMAEAINSGNEAAVAELANTVGEVSAKQEEIATMTADWQTDFTAQMDELVSKAEGAIDDMNLSEEATAAAKNTLESYASQITTSGASAVAAAQSIASQVSAALASANTTINISTSGNVTGHANGTTNAESVFVAGEEGPELIARPAAAYADGTTNSTDFYMAGENGPELIVGQQGSTVFPTEETDRLISALSEPKPLNVIAQTRNNSSGEQTTEQVKRILLEVAGSGAIEIAGNGGEADKETVLEILYEHLKPVLMSILQSDIYEEGELTYEY